MDQVDALRLLGLHDGFSEAALDHAFRTKAMAHHPDRGGDPEEMKRLVEARATLLEPVKPDACVANAARAGPVTKPSEPMDRVSFATVSFVLLVPAAVLVVLAVMTLVVVGSAR